jgi:hypothetical protein
MGRNRIYGSGAARVAAWRKRREEELDRLRADATGKGGSDARRFQELMALVARQQAEIERLRRQVRSGSVPGRRLPSPRPR